MQQNRFNMFNQVHKGLRALLYSTALQIQQTDFADNETAKQTLREVEMVVHLFEDHANNEDSFVLPAVGRFDKSLVNLFESEHKEDERLSKLLLACVCAWREAEDDNVKYEVGQLLFYHFNAFVAFNLTHMNKEESLLNEVLWKNYNDIELIGIVQQIIAAVPPQILAIESCWMLRGLNNTEISVWLQSMKNEAPVQVFQMHANMAEDELPAARWNIINASLADAVLVN